LILCVVDNRFVSFSVDSSK